MIEQQKGVEVIQGRSGNTALEPDTGTFHNSLGFDDFYNFSGLVIHSLCL
jgi:hypothetical protein